MSRDADKHWKIGQLASATGVTIRSLHHYDEIGLLRASGRTTGGHRLYSEDDVTRLYRILALRRLGFALGEVGALLDADQPDLLQTVRRHLEQVECELARHHRLRQRLAGILRALQRSIEPSVDQFIETVEVMAMIEMTIADVVGHVRTGTGRMAVARRRRPPQPGRMNRSPMLAESASMTRSATDPTARPCSRVANARISIRSRPPLPIAGSRAGRPRPALCDARGLKS